MEIRLLRYFWTIAEEGTMTRAAEVLHMTQPTLSRQIHALEEELGTSLFIRDNRRLQLTEAGLFLKSRAAEILNLTDATTHEFEERRKDLFSGNVSIGCVEAGGSKILAEMLEKFMATYPHVTFDIFTGTSDIIRDRLDKGLLDLAILLEPVDLDKYQQLRLPLIEKWGLAVSNNSWLADRDVISPADTWGLPLLLSPRTEVQQMIAKWTGKPIAELHSIGTYNLIFNASELIAHDVCATFTIEGAIENRTTTDVKFIPLQPKLETQCVLIWRQGRVLSEVAQELIKQFKQNFNQPK